MTTPMPGPKSPKRTRGLLLVLLILGGVSLVLGGLIVLLLLLARQPARSQTSAVLSQSESGQSSLARDDASTVVPQPPVVVRDFSLSNVVQVLLGAETEGDGILHLAREADGRTSVTNLDGVPCRYHNRKPRSTGYVYFSLDPDFKRDGLKSVRIEVEYRVPSPCFLRLQYDAMEPERHRPYKSAPCLSGPSVSLGTGLGFIRSDFSDGWQTAIFVATNGFFMNSQNGGADFRLEVTPPEIFLRRISVAREPSPK